MAKHDKLKLPIAKADRTTDFLILKYSSTERGKTVDVAVTDIDGLPYNLSGLDLYFVEELYNGQMVVDDGKQEISGKFVDVDLENGKFSYQFQEGIYQYDGWAHFKFVKGSNLIDTTAGFAIKIIDDIDSDLDEKSYVAYFENIKKEHQDWLDKAKELLASAQDLNSDNHQIISNCKKSLDELTKKHNDLQIQTNNLSETVNSNFTSLTGRIDSLNKEKDQLNTKVDQLTQDKNNLSAEVNNLKSVNEDLKQKIKKLTPVHVKSVNDVAKQDAYFVIVDD
ncbi:BppU family phage baseplate upper protein [Lactobacillus helveticus]|uniref:BppU family phage baseplate upper protein n=1 Tax=Lactobacillus helveticus TaxID=1587 RepID=UPI001562730B|nr:BppU family phage baseplate upper protein [Lactobacillus helveticus]NRN88436.1 Chromosome partition protein Smc [Lactobacillus helveticus]NRN92693.1 Chromosome partition protein Smc [Lactobacillus helveticus]